MKNFLSYRNMFNLAALLLLVAIQEIASQHDCSSCSSQILQDEGLKTILKDFEVSIGMQLTDEQRAASVQFMGGRCGVPEDTTRNYGDFSPTQNIANYSYGAMLQLTYKIMSYPPSSKIRGSTVTNAFESAFTAWTEGLDLQIVPSRCPGKGQLNIYFNDIDGVGGVLGYAYYPANGIIVLDKAENWSTTSDGQYVNINTVALHEVGHMLGLSHSGSYDSIMNRDYSTKWPSLSAQDKERIGNMYFKKGANRNPPGHVWRLPGEQ